MSGAQGSAEPAGGAVVIRVDDVELGDIDFAMASSGLDGKPTLVGQARRRPRQSRPQVLVRPRSRHRRRAVLLLPPRRRQVAGRGAAARRGTATTFRSRASPPPSSACTATCARSCTSPPPAARSAPACAPRARWSTPTRRARACGSRLDVEHGRGPLALLPAPLSTWLSGDPRARITINGPFTHPIIDGEVHEIDANLEGIKLTDGSAKLHFDAGKLGAPSRRRQDRARRGDGRRRPRCSAPAGTRRWRSRASTRPRSRSCPRAAAAELGGRLDGKVRLAGNLVQHRERIALTRICRPSWCATAPAAGCRAPSSSPATASTRRRVITLRGVTASGEGVTVGADGTIDPRSGRVDAGVRIDAAGASSLFARWGAPAGLHVDSAARRRPHPGALLRPTLSLHAVANNVSYARRTLDKLEADLSLRGGALDALRSARQRSRRHHRRRGRARPLRRRRSITRRATPTMRAALVAHGLSVAGAHAAGSASPARPTSTSTSKARSPIRTG